MNVPWTDSSPKAGYARGQMSDTDYYASLAIHDPLWRYIIKYYDKEIYDHQNVFPICVLGYSALPVAIELSQWGYDATFLTDSRGDLQKAKKDCEIQAGTLKNTYLFDYKRNIPRSCVVCFIGVIDTMNKVDEIYNFLDMLTRRANEVLCVVGQNKNWDRILHGRYEYKLLPYPNQPLFVLSLKALA